MRAWTFVALFFMACGDGWEANPSHHYHLEIDTNFSDAQYAAIRDAANEWQASSGNYVTFDAVSGTDDVIAFHTDTTAQINTEFGGAAGVTTYEGQSSRVDIVASLDPESFHQTALHEIGHALGLVHTNPGTIMCKDNVCATLQVTCGDLVQLMNRTVDGCFP